MSKNITIRVPNVVRERCLQVEQILGAPLGVPMDFEYRDGLPVSSDPDAGRHAKARIFWAGGLNVRITLTSGNDEEWGEWYVTSKFEVTYKWENEESARKWVADLEAIAGPLEATFVLDERSTATRAKVTLEGICLQRLEMAASNRRNDLPICRWDDPDHPLNKKRTMEARIRDAQAHGWEACKALVDQAKAEGHGPLAREIALEWYEARAIAGDEDAIKLLKGYALMAGDSQLAAKFHNEPETQEPTPLSPEAEARVRKALGLSPNDKLIPTAKVRPGRTVYRP